MYNNFIFFYPALEKGGATKILVNLVNFFLKKGINIQLICLNASSQLFKDPQKKLKIIKIKNFKLKYLFKSRLLFSFASLYLLCKELIKQERKTTKVFSLQSHFISVILSKIFLFKVDIRNSEDPFGATRYADNKFIGYLIFLTKFISFNLANRTITNATRSLKSIRFFLLNKKKVILILNPYVSHKKKKIKIRKKIRKKQILIAGRFTKQKNFKFAIKVFKEISTKLKNYKLVIVGNGSQKKQILNLIKFLNLKNKVRIYGWTNNLDKYFQNSKIFLLPSLYEGSPNILIDAISNGIPCISSNCSGAADILKKNKAGLIYPINNKKILIKDIFKIINNYKIYEKYALKFRDKQSRFLTDNQSLQYLKVLKN